MKIGVRLLLKTPLTWDSNNPEKPHKMGVGLVTINKKRLPFMGQTVSFEDLRPFSNIGDTAEHLYPQLKGRRFTRIVSAIQVEYEFEEI